MEIKNITWSIVLDMIHILVCKGELTELQLEKIIDLVDIKDIVKNNLLSNVFIKKYIEPRIDLDDYDGIDLYSIEKYQNNLKNKKYIFDI